MVQLVLEHVQPAVLFPLSNGESNKISTKPVGNRVSSEECEIEGIIIGL